MVDYYPVGAQSISLDTIALGEFGGQEGDHPWGVIRVDGWPRVGVLLPRPLADPASETYARFQDAVRELALTYDFQGRNISGPVDIVWKPGNRGISTQYGVAGEPVDRVL